MPYTQHPAWLEVQKKCPIHQVIHRLMQTGQTPDKKKTKGNNTVIKHLFNLHRANKLKSEKGLLLVLVQQLDGTSKHVISIPPIMMPGLVQALHIKASHPTKTQTLRLMRKHFYAPAMEKAVNEVVEGCDVCVCLKQLPGELFDMESSSETGFCKEFYADVLMGNDQSILLVREKISQFLWATIVDNQTAKTLEQAMLAMMVDWIPEDGAVVRVDNA